MSHFVETTWSPGSLPGDILSHPDKSLQDHLEGTERLAQNLADYSCMAVDRELLRWVCITHDLEKSHPFFQDYLLKKRGSGVNHARPSSCFTLDATSDLWAVEAVRRHHTHIEDEIVSTQFWMEREDEHGKILHDMLDRVPSWKPYLDDDGWSDLINDFFDLDISEADWLKLRLLYSLLVAADRMDAIGISRLDMDSIPDFTPIDFSSRKPIPLDDWRGKVYRKTMERSSLIDKPGIYTLTLPTGAGKTTIGLEIAYKVAKKMDCKTIIYALPFISIIDQNASVAKELLGEDYVQEDHSQIVTSESDSKKDEAEKQWQKMSVMFRYWRSPVILTTMVQLWDAIFDPHANSSMDFHRLSKSVVLMDEPQGINPELWNGFGKVLSFLSEELGTVFILMTATQPHIGKGIEIAPGDIDFPYNRHNYAVLPDKYELESLTDVLFDNLDVQGGSGLVVLNTRKSALKVHGELQSLLDCPVFFLSSWMTPCHRRKVMAKLKDLEKKGQRHCLVSTQVVEAGVDLDFDWVFRDMGPLDSVIQVAGRCNRHLKKDTPGEVLIAELISKNGKAFSSYVYNSVLLDASRDLLKKAHTFGESSVSDMVSFYYERVLDGIVYAPVWENIKNGIWGPEKKIDLIHKEYRQNERVFVELDDKIRPILNRLSSQKWTLENIDEKKVLSREAQQYAIEVSIKELFKWRANLSWISTDDENPPLSKKEERDYWFITKAGIDKIYSKEWGFTPFEILKRDDSYDSFI